MCASKDWADSLCFCRPSQLASRGLAAIAASLTEGLRASGHMGIAEPEIGEEPMDTDDEDTIMLPAKTQFTQSLMLFVRSAHPPEEMSHDADAPLRSRKCKVGISTATRRTSRGSSPHFSRTRCLGSSRKRSRRWA